MNVIVCGLNAYLGRACLQFLQSDDFNIHGIIRDQTLLKSKLNFETKAQLYNFDIVRYNPRGLNLQLPPSQLAFYFTQTPELNDEVGANYELLSIRNFIQFCNRNNCNRIVYVGTIYDRKYLQAIEMLFQEFNIFYTIILKDVAVGSGTAFENFMIKMLKHKLIYLFKPTEKIILNPITLVDLMQWIKSVDWINNYLNEIIIYKGNRSIEIEDLMKRYFHKSPQNHKIIPIKNKRIAILLNKYLSGISYEQYIEYISEILDQTDISGVKIIESNKNQLNDILV